MFTLKNKKYYTTKEIAKICKVDRTTVIRWVKNGKLVPFKFGPRKFLYDEDAFEKCIRGE